MENQATKPQEQQSYAKGVYGFLRLFTDAHIITTCLKNSYQELKTMRQAPDKTTIRKQMQHSTLALLGTGIAAQQISVLMDRANLNQDESTTVKALCSLGNSGILWRDTYQKINYAVIAHRFNNITNTINFRSRNMFVCWALYHSIYATVETLQLLDHARELTSNTKKDKTIPKHIETESNSKKKKTKKPDNLNPKPEANVFSNAPTNN